MWLVGLKAVFISDFISVTIQYDKRMSTKHQRQVCALLISVVILFGLLSLCADATEDNITRGQFLTDGQTIISAGKKFELGFFSPGNSSNRYVGIWYYKFPVQTVVWVANRESPILDRRGVLNITVDGNLVVMDGDGKLVWSTNVSIKTSNSTAVLMDSGNLLLRSDKVLWQSFSDPTDTFLPGMKMGYNPDTGENNTLTSWKSAHDPSKGNYHVGVDSLGSPQILIWEGLTRRWRSGLWNGTTLVGVSSMGYLYLSGFELITDTQKGVMYFTYTLPKNCILRYRIRWDGSLNELLWDEKTKEWNLTWSAPTECEIYNMCGAFGRCSLLDSHSPSCSCLYGYEPKDSLEWYKGNWSGGCVRRIELQCEKNSSEVEPSKEDGFRQLDGIKLPDFSNWVTVNGIGECKDECLRNCSCRAYAYVSGIGCMIWSGDLVDVQQFQEAGNTIYIHLAASELLGASGNSGLSKPIIVIIAISGVVFLSMSIYLLYIFIPKLRDLSRKRYKKQQLIAWSKNREFYFVRLKDLVREEQQGDVPELPLFNFDCVAVATSNFSEANKLGQGGFGPVYKGMLSGGQEIAVKRLSRSSIQGLEEFMNEIILIAKLQHRNLVRLLGCCIQGEEKMLLYEYMPNGSLDSFIFDPAKKGQLDWRKRIHIIEGIARGLLYLHRDSRLRIIHRDLKASNILLDNEMNPKISDFGMAKIFGGNQNRANTNRVVGTYGYMSPEYAMEGLVSVKTDVYSFGVLLLEIVSGQRNSYISHSDHYSNLIGYAWHLWSEEKGNEFMDSSIVDTCFNWEILRCIQVGLLCVQDSAMERPTMSSVLLMLESETAIVPNPKQPTFAVVRNCVEKDLYVESPEVNSTNNLTVTTAVGR
ncbi:putative G-type lectin S-receptor-like serine/threonine-protein kinase At1g61610 isoform X2 [Macadamia integrifolia]|uniref:putative G-type lectin S-receptor-like serine/threonine-protein kinase At1g61610 isoform X2 n=1 Tax=Macadamia integrifolia TaxID=60698 RepID=UPI001C52FFB9|nr:putative G-type lectin S-receptor-like serine/threonine-protein kinase At1g61610 isoform X2 [Macadamia integrifolia]